MASLKNNLLSILLFLSCLVFYFIIAYDLERTHFLKLLVLYSGLFLFTWKFFELQRKNLKLLLIAAALFRLLFLVATPNLSQDFYRFIWDGSLLLEAVSPYQQTPNEWMSEGYPFEKADFLHHKMGSLSADNPTSYPPLNQLLFSLAVFLGGKSLLGSVIWLRLMIIGAEVGIFYIGIRILKNLKLPQSNIFFYLLNPLIIIELTGNLHFEGVMLVFLLLAIYALTRHKWLYTAIYISCSIAVKLIPLMFLPLLFKRLKWKNAIVFYGTTTFFLFLFFFPLLNLGSSENFLSSISLWFTKFEFNASIYYLIRWTGYLIEGYNIIGFAGPALAILVVFSIMLIAFRERNIEIRGLLVSMMFSIIVYFLLATTVHPWYLATPLLLSVFTRFKFVQVWSFMVILSYFTYSQEGYRENLLLIAIEYAVVLGVLLYEVLYSNKENIISMENKKIRFSKGKPD